MNFFSLAPSKPLNISVLNLNPTLINVSWLPPEELNGIIIYYEVHWQTDSVVSALRQKGELSVIDSETLTTHLNKLAPNETYIIWVRAYSETNESWTESDRVRITTYPEPDSIGLLNKTAYSIQLSWNMTPYVENYTVEYAPIASTIWTRASVLQNKNNSVSIGVDKLKPKQHYKFRVILLYKGNTDLYIWPSDTRFTYETNGKSEIKFTLNKITVTVLDMLIIINFRSFLLSHYSFNCTGLPLSYLFHECFLCQQESTR